MDTTFPGVLVVGQREHSQGVERTLAKLRVVVRHCDDVDEAKHEVSANTLAVVLVTPLEHADTLEAVLALTGEKRPADVAVLVVVPDEYPDRRARRLYAAGATAVFDWPHEALILPTMVTDLLGAAPKSGTAGDAALLRAVKARLELSDYVDGDVSATVTGGTVCLTGNVKSYWAKQRVCQMMEHVPGVTAVTSRRLDVVPPKRPDDDLSRQIRDVLRSVSAVDGKTISVAVDDGHVVLAGTVASASELTRLANVAGNVEGVRSVQSLVTVSPGATHKARGLATRLRKGIQAAWPNAETNTTVFGSMAVVSGHVRTLADKRAIEAFVRHTRGIDRVVNKLRVRP